MSTDPAGGPALATLRRARAQQEAALRWMRRLAPSLQFQEVSGVPCQFTVSGQAYELPSEARLAVYRVAQEALTNITRHACPERVEVQLGYGPGGTRLTVELRVPA